MSILSIASNASVWRGYEYYNEKKVLSWKQTEEHKFEGEVVGSEKEPYHVMIDTEHPKKSKCNCPHAEGKKLFVSTRLPCFLRFFLRKPIVI
ncbi:hypothetical protein [Clostridium sp. KNHs205]|jgi:uncharacterized Zn finger protein|uniref:SWIM zinc finger family protein n=1 Tax=Clostridium sp. KNHs205 TaxID=1449050 RepID=UPI0018CBFFF2|nr:hypothetical protein [Clostridium sp. KNHs205]